MSKKIVIPRDSLPPTFTSNNSYQIRFRLISEDRNRVSAWSPIFTVNPDFIYTTTGSITLSKTTGQVSAVWPAVTVKKGATGTASNVNGYDVWVRWNTSAYGNTELGTWIYFGSVPTPSVTLSIPAGMTYFSIEVYRKGIPIARSQSNGYKVFSSYDYVAV